MLFFAANLVSQKVLNYFAKKHTNNPNNSIY